MVLKKVGEGDMSRYPGCRPGVDSKLSLPYPGDCSESFWTTSAQLHLYGSISIPTSDSVTRITIFGDSDSTQVTLRTMMSRLDPARFTFFTEW